MAERRSKPCEKCDKLCNTNYRKYISCDGEQCIVCDVCSKAIDTLTVIEMKCKSCGGTYRRVPDDSNACDECLYGPCTSDDEPDQTMIQIYSKQCEICNKHCDDAYKEYIDSDN